MIPVFEHLDFWTFGLLDFGLFDSYLSVCYPAMPKTACWLGQSWVFVFGFGGVGAEWPR